MTVSGSSPFKFALGKSLDRISEPKTFEVISKLRSFQFVAKKTKGQLSEVFSNAMNIFCDVIHTVRPVRLCRCLYIPTLTAKRYMTSGFRSEADENCTLLVYYATSTGNFLQTFRDNLSVPSSGVMKPKENCTVCYRSSCSQQAPCRLCIQDIW